MKEKVYIVDDTQIFLKLFAHMLNEYDVTTFLNPIEAYEAITTSPPDLVLTDLEMPEISGIELLKKIRANEKICNLPVIICTSHDAEEALQEAFKEGVNEFLSKDSVSGLVLNIRVQTILESAKKTKQIEEMNQEKATFLRVLCHDIVNPLSVARGFHKILAEKVENPDKRTQYAISNLEKSLDKIKEILTYTRERFSIEDNKKKIELGHIKSSDLINEIEFLTKSLIDEKNINYEVICNDLNLEMVCEVGSITNQVFANLFTNAVKFTPENGKITFKIYEQDNQVVLELKDYGIGIPQELIDQLFNPSSTTSRRGTNGEKGTGYGLPLVKTFIETYGGSIEVSSHDIEQYPIDHWSEFRVILKKFTL
ncbi:MAG: HAMP domain-containing histidine kinase [Halobacteriovoraceae bacterium]|nr:HAMP domain-containing histidine kinase [Halobacteriovoraceae bacterium]